MDGVTVITISIILMIRPILTLLINIPVVNLLIRRLPARLNALEALRASLVDLQAHVSKTEFRWGTPILESKPKPGYDNLELELNSQIGCLANCSQD